MALKQLALSFWLTVPAASVAEHLGINVKTVRRHYGLMRRGLVLEPLCPAHDPGRKSAGDEKKVGLCVWVVEGGIRIAAVCCEWAGEDAPGPPGDLEPCRHGRIRKKLRLPTPLHDIDCSLCFVDGSIGEWTSGCVRELAKLEKLATKLCRMERRGSRSQSVPLLEELAFRFNHRGNPGVTAMLYDFMKPVCRSRYPE